MDDQHKSRAQLMGELLPIRQRVVELEQAVAEHKRMEKELRRSEERYRSIVEDMPLLICRFLPNGILSYVNHGYCIYFGKQYEELVGHDFFQFIPTQDRERVREHYRSISKEKPAITYEHRVISPNETERWQRWTDRGIYNASGTLVEYQSIGEDITDRKEAEEELRESKKMLEMQNELLNDKNAALREILRQIEEEKTLVKDKIMSDVDHLIMPLLTRIRESSSLADEQYVDLLEENLKGIISGFSHELYHKSTTLSSRELEIANMIRTGYSTKDIARQLNRSVKTIEAHRNNIRKKLGIRNTNANLNTYLKSL
ncbi:helix-turn-helix transcriptional regulator [Candidatus Neomarinimicrobiota bacterium]